MEKPDKSLSFKDTTYAVGEIEPVESDSGLVRKIDWHIVPIMFLVYFLQFLDKVTLNVSEKTKKNMQ